MNFCDQLAKKEAKLAKLVAKRKEQEEPLRMDIMDSRMFVGYNQLKDIYAQLGVEDINFATPSQLESFSEYEKIPLATIVSGKLEYEIRLFFDGLVSVRNNNISKIMDNADSAEKYEAMIHKIISISLIGNSKRFYQSLDPQRQQQLASFSELQIHPDDPYLYTFKPDDKNFSRFNIRLCATIIV